MSSPESPEQTPQEAANPQQQTGELPETHRFTVLNLSDNEEGVPVGATITFESEEPLPDIEKKEPAYDEALKAMVARAQSRGATWVFQEPTEPLDATPIEEDVMPSDKPFPGNVW